MSEEKKGPVHYQSKLAWKEEWWKFLVAVEELKEPRDLELFLDAQQLTMEDAHQFNQAVKSFGLEIKMAEGKIYPLEKSWKLSLEFSFSEWMAFQEYWAKYFKHSTETFSERIVEQKLNSISLVHEKYLIFKKEAAHVPEEKKLKKMELWTKKLDRTIVARKLVDLIFYNHKKVSFYPHRLVYLDGVLCVVGEEKYDRSLAFFGLEDIANIEDLDFEIFDPRFTPIEINEFIHSCRVINGREERVVLKVYSQGNVDLLPRFHHLGNPFVTSNGEGDLIWAATIEICDDFYQWLHQMKDHVEVLDPGHVRKEFSLYCELKKQADSKKAG